MLARTSPTKQYRLPEWDRDIAELLNIQVSQLLRPYPGAYHFVMENGPVARAQWSQLNSAWEFSIMLGNQKLKTRGGISDQAIESGLRDQKECRIWSKSRVLLTLRYDPYYSGEGPRIVEIVRPATTSVPGDSGSLLRQNTEISRKNFVSHDSGTARAQSAANGPAPPSKRSSTSHVPPGRASNLKTRNSDSSIGSHGSPRTR